MITGIPRLALHVIVIALLYRLTHETTIGIYYVLGVIYAQVDDIGDRL